MSAFAEPACPHTFTSMLLHKPVPTYCGHCKKLMLVWEGKARFCSLCPLIVHEKCFAAFNAAAAAAAAASAPSAAIGGCDAVASADPTPPQSGPPITDFDVTEAALLNSLHTQHHHEFRITTFFTPHFCDSCGKLLVGLRRQGYECVGCDIAMHEDCARRAPNSSIICPEQMASEQEAAAQVEQLNQKEVMGDVFGLLKRFNERNHRWQWTALNPIQMMALYNRHATLHIETCAKLPDASFSQRGLKRLSNAVRFATAAYGEAYLNGYFTSELRTGLMRVTARDLFHPKVENHIDAIAKILACPRQHIIHASVSGSIFGATYFVYFNPPTKEVILSFRGSLSDADFLTDATGKLKEFCGGLCHDGMVRVVQQLWEEGECVQIINKILASCPEASLTVTGHSLGGGLTELFIIKAVTEKTFGEATPIHGCAIAPPPVATLPLAGQFDDYLTSIVAGKDMVPRLQLNSVDRLGRELAAAASSGQGSQAQPVEGELQDECHIVGEVLLLTRPDNASSGRLVAIPRTDETLHKVLLSRHMVDNHYMDHYQAGVMVAVKRAAAMSLSGSAEERGGEGEGK